MKKLLVLLSVLIIGAALFAQPRPVYIEVWDCNDVQIPAGDVYYEAIIIERPAEVVEINTYGWEYGGVIQGYLSGDVNNGFSTWAPGETLEITLTQISTGYSVTNSWEIGILHEGYEYFPNPGGLELALGFCGFQIVSGTAPIGTILTHTGFNNISPFEVVDGSYSLEAEEHSSVSIIPTKDGYYFEPENYSNLDLTESVTQNFEAFEMAPEILIEPNETNFGNVFINEIATLPVIVYNIGQLDLVISNVLVSTDIFSVSLPERDLSFTVAPSDSQIVNVSFSPVLVEENIGSVYFLTNDPNNNMLTYPVSGSGYIFEADFTASPLSGETPLDVQFTDTSVGDIQSWNWSFGDSQTSNAQNPNHIYEYDGVYSVTLVVNDNVQQRTLTQENLIEVNGHPILSSPDSLGIDFESLYFTDSSGDSLIIIQNVGTKAFQIDGLSFVENTGAFNFNYQNIGVPILPNETDTIYVNFFPPSVGGFDDNLLITNTSENHPSYEVSLSGICDYAPPKAPENVQVNVIYPDAIVTWDEVTENISVETNTLLMTKSN